MQRATLGFLFCTVYTLKLSRCFFRSLFLGRSRCKHKEEAEMQSNYERNRKEMKKKRSCVGVAVCVCERPSRKFGKAFQRRIVLFVVFLLCSNVIQRRKRYFCCI